MKHYIAVDGGGTKTECVLVAENGIVLDRIFGASSNSNDVGKDNAINLIVSLCKQILPKDAQCVHVAVGGSGIQTSGIAELLTCKLKEISCVQKVIVVSDIHTAYFTACDDNDGILIIGTGCIAYTIINGKEYRIGGGGYMIDDLYSGFDLGKALLNAVLESVDGRGEKTLLTDLFTDRVGHDIYTEIKNIYTGGKAYVASFAPLVFTAYDKGDKVAKNILARSIFNLERVLSALYVVCGKPICKVAVFGGLSKRLELLDKFLSNNIKQKVNLLIIDKPILLGAIKGLTKTDSQFDNNFVQSYNLICQGI